MITWDAGICKAVPAKFFHLQHFHATKVWIGVDYLTMIWTFR